MPMPTKLNEDVIEEACRWLRRGHFAQHVAMALGVAESTYYEWLEKGEALVNTPDDELRLNQPLFKKFYLESRKATFEAIDRNLGMIGGEKGIGGGARWFLEKRCQDLYGGKHRIDVTSNDESVGAVAFYPENGRAEKRRREQKRKDNE